MHAVEDTYQNGIKIKFGHESSGTQAMHFGSIMKGTVLADKIRSNMFRAVFWTPGLAPVILDIAYLVALVLWIPNWYYTSL